MLKDLSVAEMEMLNTMKLIEEQIILVSKMKDQEKKLKHMKKLEAWYETVADEFKKVA